MLTDEVIFNRPITKIYWAKSSRDLDLKFSNCDGLKGLESPSFLLQAKITHYNLEFSP